MLTLYPLPYVWIAGFLYQIFSQHDNVSGGKADGKITLTTNNNKQQQ